MLGKENGNGNGSIDLKIPKSVWLPIIIGVIAGGSVTGIFGNLLGQTDYITKEKYMRDSLIQDKRFEVIMDTLSESNKLIRDWINKEERQQKRERWFKK